MKSAGVWTNLLLSCSNIGAAFAAVLAFNEGEYLLAVALANAGVASFLFHSCECNKHPVLPGLLQYPVSESSLLTYDRISAVACVAVVASTYGLSAVVSNPLVWLALGVNAISELHYVGIVKNPKWDIYVYTSLHSLWHVLVFGIPMMLITS